MHRSMSMCGCRMASVVGADIDRRGGTVGASARAGRDLIAFHFEKLHSRTQCLADHQLKRAVSRLEIGAQILHLFDTFQKFPTRIFVQALKALLAKFVEDVALSRKIAYQNALSISYGLRLDVLVRGGVLQDRTDVDAALMRERRLPDERLI